MDCPAEENLIRMQLQNMDSVRGMEFDLKKRTLGVLSTEGPQPLTEALESLGMGARLLDSRPCGQPEEESSVQPAEESSVQRRALWAVLAINLAFFVIEAVFGILSDSMGLVADSLDMLSDALVYGMSLMVVGAALSRKKLVARLSGYMQAGLAVWGLAEVLQRVLQAGPMPGFSTIVVVSVFALAANVASLLILQRSGSRDVHIRASIICSSNDVITNAGVILAGVLVWALDSRLPDLIVGGVVFVLVLRGAVRMLRLAR